MKISKKDLKNRFTALPNIKFDEQSLTSYAGIPILQLLFIRLGLRDRVRQCFAGVHDSSGYTCSTVALFIVVHLLLGHRKLSDVMYYNDDPMVLRLLNLNALPSCSTVSRKLAMMDADNVRKYRCIVSEIVLDRVEQERFNRVTLDFDGSVLSTSRFAEGTAVGFNKKKKGQRSYYPLYCTIAQTGSVLDIHHRPGNVHDSNGAEKFILDCISTVKSRLPHAVIEVRMDSAFFSEAIIKALTDMGVEFTVSVPFARYPELKGMIEKRKRWKRMDNTISFFQTPWKPKSWENTNRFLFVRTRKKIQKKGPVQLDLFEPYNHEYEYSVVITNKKTNVKKTLSYHHGRGSQESIFAELKTHLNMDYIPTRKLIGNQIYMLSAILAHNIGREMQMIANEKERGTTEKRAARWVFEKIGTIRKNLIQRAGRITFPQGKITLSLNANDVVENQFNHYMTALAG
jgi:hypothetical protein